MQQTEHISMLPETKLIVNEIIRFWFMLFATIHSVGFFLWQTTQTSLLNRKFTEVEIDFLG